MHAALGEARTVLAEDRIVARLRDELASGRWDAEHGHLRAQREYDGSLRLVVSEP